MSSIIKFELKELRKLASDKNACIDERKVTQNLAVQPWCLGNLNESIKSLLDYKIGKFDKEFDGILLSYKNLHVLQNVGAIRHDNADIHFQVQADYFIFRPYIGAKLRGVVNKKSLTHLGIIVHRVFNVVIPRPTEEPDGRWIGTKVKEGQEVVFEIVMLDLFGALPYIRGELDERYLKLSPDDEDDSAESNDLEKIDVSYVKFEKTKPRMQEQSGDCTPKTPAKPSGNIIDESPKLKKNSCRNSSFTNTVDEQSYTVIKKKKSDANKLALDKQKPKRQRQSEGTSTEEQEPAESVTRKTRKHKKKDT